ncbi:ICP35 [Psittacid alphaherpesvirus 1]|uniref:capsid maturation protease n=1 Tax=Psittacid alphaherpesvirus 1 TaxID=50294 RepID=UPI00001C1899|nr:capsid maturation protease [Psittacid alphaherpesvirus 1]AAQ73704.1 ICP35 [Psittacid alphaherpesvirus 1]
MVVAEQLEDVFVGGYLVIYASQDGAGEEYRLPKEVVARALPVEPGRVPVNINHDASCRVGSVISIVDVEKGLFFLGVVSGSLALAMFKYVARDLFRADDGDSPGGGAESETRSDEALPANTLSEREKFLYLLSNVLPSLSLSSARLADGYSPADDFFAHVALCELGKRDGTIAIYGSSPPEVLDAFSGLDDAAKRELARSAEEWTTSSRREEPVDEAMVSECLLRKFMNNAFLMDRGEYLRARRHLADVRRPKYLQAAETTCLSSANPRSSGKAAFSCEARGLDEAGAGAIGRAPESGMAASADQHAQDGIKIRLERSRSQIGPGAMSSVSQPAAAPYSGAMADSAAQVPSAQPPRIPCPPTGQTEMIYVPLGTYNDLVVSAAQARRGEDRRQQLSAPPPQHAQQIVQRETGINSSSPALAPAGRGSYASASHIMHQPAFQTQQPCWPQQQQYVQAPCGGHGIGYYGQAVSSDAAAVPGTAPQLLVPQGHQAPAVSPCSGCSTLGRRRILRRRSMDSRPAFRPTVPFFMLQDTWARCRPFRFMRRSRSNTRLLSTRG